MVPKLPRVIMAHKTKPNRAQQILGLAQSADGFCAGNGRNTKMIPENPNAGKTILFADDDGQLQKFVAALLTKSGYHLILASNGLDALQKARAYEGVIHLLLSDIEVPGMTAIELAIQLGQERPDTKILLISGLDSGILVLNNGWQFLPKPFMGDMLRDRVRDFLSEQPSIKEHLAAVLAEVKRQPSLQGHADEVAHLAEALIEVVPEAMPVVPVNGAPPLT
jgi:DNA-binding NtrC family response regulator